MSFTLKKLGLVALCGLLVLSALEALCASEFAPGDRRGVCDFNDDWFCAAVLPENIRQESIRTFQRGDQLVAEKTEEFQSVRLPHDWAIEQGFDKSLDGDTGMAKWRGVVIYRKFYRPDDVDKGKRFILELDGAMSFPEVYVNGLYAGGWDYGYLGFQVDLTDFLKFDQTNELLIRCDARDHKSRWYPGLGVYRNVKLLKVSHELWLPQGAAQISFDNVSVNKDESTGKFYADADLSVDVTPEVLSAVDANVTLQIFAPDGKELAKQTKSLSLKVNAEKNDTLQDSQRYPQYDDQPVFQFQVKLSHVLAWDVDQPSLHYAVVTFEDQHGRRLDQTVERFGVRTAVLTVDNGFFLNGRRLQLYGVDLHHDQGVLGAVSHPAAVRRQLEIMRDMGANAVRTSHNPNSSTFMDACDELGFVVWDELFDKWDGTAGLRSDDDFFAFSARQARQFVRRDRNRPCVIAWSIGNEIADIERNSKGASNPQTNAKARVAHLADAVRQYDSSRLVGQGCFVESAIGDFPPKNDAISPLDVHGWNYGAKYRFGRRSYPQKPVVYTESASAFSTRDYFDPHHPVKKDQYDFQVKQVDSYDLVSANGPRDIPEYDFERMLQDQYVAGEFVWTGFDYIGESAPFQKDANLCYFGIVDITGAPKSRFYLYRSHWNKRDKTAYILPYWNWEGREGEVVPVYVYTSGDSAELFLNGKSLGRKYKDLTRTLEMPKDATFDLPEYYWIIDKYRLRWEDVVYEPGELLAVCYQGDEEIARYTTKTAGKVAVIKMLPEGRSYTKYSNVDVYDNDDLIYIPIEAFDADGIACRTADNTFEVEVQGAGTLAGLGNGNPLACESFADAKHCLFYGKALLVVRTCANNADNTVRVILRSQDLPEQVVEFKVK
ncbi:MAG: glycoside hydrolase family 2 TIM barrel-domain containing protein [Planctomycetia bacterium]|nr:glycoside hydrolase family 2 TIM barrel-domain containing protein [Planctomycetia bacterium]